MHFQILGCLSYHSSDYCTVLLGSVGSPTILFRSVGSPIILFGGVGCPTILFGSMGSPATLFWCYGMSHPSSWCGGMSHHFTWCHGMSHYLFFLCRGMSHNFSHDHGTSHYFFWWCGTSHNFFLVVVGCPTFFLWPSGTSHHFSLCPGMSHHFFLWRWDFPSILLPYLLSFWVYFSVKNIDFHHSTHTQVFFSTAGTHKHFLALLLDILYWMPELPFSAPLPLASQFGRSLSYLTQKSCLPWDSNPVTLGLRFI